jgi:tRNA U34 5-carboxymethylaminomethyl modifying GTPase MnmE/TrmE
MACETACRVSAVCVVRLSGCVDTSVVNQCYRSTEASKMGVDTERCKVEDEVTIQDAEVRQ